MHWKLNSRSSVDAKSRNINILIYTPVCVSCTVRTWCQYFPYNITENSENTMVIIVFGDSCTTVAQPRPGQNLQSFFTSLLGRPTACEACNYTWSCVIILNHTDGITPLHMDSKNHKFYRPPLCRIVLRVCIVKFYQPVWTIHGIVGPSYQTQPRHYFHIYHFNYKYLFHFSQTNLCHSFPIAVLLRKFVGIESLQEVQCLEHQPDIWSDGRRRVKQWQERRGWWMLLFGGWKVDLLLIWYVSHHPSVFWRIGYKSEFVIIIVTIIIIPIIISNNITQYLTQHVQRPGRPVSLRDAMSRTFAWACRFVICKLLSAIYYCMRITEQWSKSMQQHCTEYTCDVHYR